MYQGSGYAYGGFVLGLSQFQVLTELPRPPRNVVYVKMTQK